MNVFSLFAGIGGIDLGLEQLGWDTVAFSEFDPKIAKKKKGRQYAAEVMQQRFPQAVSVGDITELTFARNREGIPGILRRRKHEDGSDDVGYDVFWKGPIDVIAGGFPCQDISLAGKGAGIEEGTRSGLWRYFAEAIEGLRPRGVLIENVAALAGKGLDRVLRDLSNLGYDAEWDVIAAAGVGAPHLRERMFILAWPHGEGDHGPWVTPPVFDNWLEEPDLPRLTTDDVEQRTARLRCLGNAVVPQIAAWVGAILRSRIDDERFYAGVDPATWDAKHGRGELKGESKYIGVAGEATTIAGAKLPRAGRMTAGQVFERKRSCEQKHAKATGLKYMAATLRPRAGEHDALPVYVPTPNAQVSQDGEGPDTWLERRDEMKAKGYNGNGAGMPLSIYAQLKPDRLVPTPTAKDADSSRSRTAVREVEPARASQMGETLTDYVDPTNGGRLLPTPQAADGERTTDYQQRSDGSNPTLQGAAKLLPTPTTSDGGASDHRVGGANLEHEAKLLPTPKATDGDKGVRSIGGSVNEMRRGKGGDLNAAIAVLDSLEQRDNLIPTPRASEYKGVGPLGSKSHEYRVEKGYLDATIQEIEQKTGRLNPEWVGWLMGFPADWTVVEP